MRRVVVFAPHFAEYSMRLATALSQSANVLLITEARNLAVECVGLDIGPASPRFANVSFASDLALRRLSFRAHRETRRIRRAIEAFKPDVIHIQEQGDRFTADMARSFSRACPIVLTVHDPVPHSGSDALVAKYFARGLRQLRALASAYHVHGARCEALLRDKLATSKPIAATSHGVILTPPRPGVAAIASNRFLFFGRMEAYKGLETLLDAIDLLPAGHGERFVFAGRGPELERFRGRIAAQPMIELIDRYLPPLEAIHEFQRARAVLVPYRDATQSGVISAAVANGKPVIASRVGGLVDAVDDGTTGLMVPPDDPASLAAAIQALADDATVLRLADGARAAAKGRFAWAAIAAQLHAFYDHLLAERGGSEGGKPGTLPTAA